MKLVFHNVSNIFNIHAELTFFPDDQIVIASKIPLFSFGCACKLYRTLRSSEMLCEVVSKGQKSIQHAVFGRMSSSFYKSISIRPFISRNRQILILTCRDLTHQYIYTCIYCCKASAITMK